MRRYGLDWHDNTPDLKIEFACIRKGGRWTEPDGTVCGAGLYEHYYNAWRLMWPEDDHHRWAELGLRRIGENEINTFMGPGDSNKTFLVSKFVMSDWWVDPLRTLWLVSSTDRRGAELRIWGKIKEFFNRAKERFPWLPGKVLESRGCITPDSISDDGEKARLLTRGIIFIPCKQGNTWLGLGPYAGIKPPPDGKLGHAGDEVSLMHPSFLDAYANWYGKANFRGLLTGNPGDLLDPLCTAGEPLEGWDSWKDNGKTQEWRSKFYNAWVVAFDGRDTPNNDFPYVNGKPRYPYLVGKKKLEAVKAQYGENDWHWWNQCVGKPQTSIQARRVVTRAIFEQNGAFDDVIWDTTDGLTKVCSLDAAYGGIGGDRCIIADFEFGKSTEGHRIFSCNNFEQVPVSVKNPEPPEVQIARFVKRYCEARGILPNNFFFDGRSTLAMVLAEYWDTGVNVVDFGGPATARPVSNDEYIWKGDEEGRRLKLCNEHYFNFVTELWFCTYYLAISKQLRNLPKDVAREGYQRTWKLTKGNRIQVEPKEEMKQRTTNSPDYYDCFVTGLEGARRLGFEIQSQRDGRAKAANTLDWLQKEVDTRRKFLRQSELRTA